VEFLKQRYPGKRILHAEVCPNPIYFDVKRKKIPGQPVLLYVGTLGYRKGTDLLMRALSRFGGSGRIEDEAPGGGTRPTGPLSSGGGGLDFKAIIVTTSSTAEAEHWRAQLPESARSKVEFKHSARPAEIASLFEIATLMLLPTRADTGPVAAKEAAVAGIPVIGSNIGGMPDYIVPDKNGLLFTAGNPEEFQRCLEQALKHPLFSLGHVEAATLESARRYLSPQTMAANFLRIYRETAGIGA
jgi:glycosyltransferase involved in cell wall biosynthesis